MSTLPRVAALLVPIAAAILAGCGGSDTATPASRDADSAPMAAPVATASSQADPPPAAAPMPATTATASAKTSTAATAESERAPATAQTSGTSTHAATAAPARGGSAMAPMPGIVTRQTDLKAEPAPAARTLRSFAAKTPVTITARQGGWLQVTSGDARGWVRLLHVSSQPSAPTSGARADLEAAARVATGRAGSGNIAVTTGIRGLDEEELREAQPNPEELKRLESLGAEPADAQNHAKRRGLERRQVPYPKASRSR